MNRAALPATLHDRANVQGEARLAPASAPATYRLLLATQTIRDSAPRRPRRAKEGGQSAGEHFGLRAEIFPGPAESPRRRRRETQSGAAKGRAREISLGVQLESRW